MKRRVSVQTPLGEALQFRQLVGREALSQLYSFEVDLLGQSNALEAKSLLGKTATVAVETESGGVRHLGGIVTRFGLQQEDARHAFYRMQLRPWLWLATRRSDFRIFQGRSVPDILDEVLGRYGQPVEKKLSRSDYRRWDYCVQYHESDFQFVSRLCALEGIYYYFRHEAAQQVLVFADDIASSHPPLPGGETVRFHPLEKSGMGQRERIYAWDTAEEVRAGHHYNDDYDFEKPQADLSHLRQMPPGHDHDSYENYEWPGGFVQHADGETYARIRNEEQLSQRHRASGRSNLRALATGHTIRLAGHPRADQNQQYLLVAVSYHLQENLQASEGAEAGEGSVQRFAFDVQPTSYPWRPARTTPKPRTRGPQTAMVVGPAGQEIWTDAYGRIKVQFHWDRLGQKNENSSCWVRVSTAWAGGTFGMTSVPRIGMEVIVDFLNGDPDHPIVTGCVHNADTMPAWQLPEQKHLSGIRSRELGGGRSNHVVLDDTQGRIQAQLRSDHQASQLSVGHIGRIEDTAGRKDSRGQGFELRTDGHGVARAAKGLLVTTEARPAARAHITDMGETVGRLTQARDLHEGLSEAARATQAHDAGDQDEVAAELKAQNDAIKGQGGGDREQGEFPEFEEAHLTLASAKGLQTVAQGSTHVVSNEHNALTSGGHTSVSAGKSFLVSVQSAIRMFASKAGMRLVAAGADIDIKALKESVNVLAKLNITQTANRITIQAKEEVVINGGSSYSRWSSGGIEHGTSGTWREHAAVHSLVGPASEGKPSLPNPPQLPRGQLDLYHQYILPTGEKHQGVAQGDFTVVDSEGGTHAGTFDRNGFASVSGLPIGAAKVTFGQDPRDPWEEGSYFGTPQDWKGKPPAAGGFDMAGAASGVSGLLGGAGGFAGMAGSAGGAAAALAGVAGTGSQAASRLGQVAEAAGMAQQAVSAAQAIQQGGAKALLGQASQAATGMAMQAAGARLGPAGTQAVAMANMAGGIAKGGLPGGAASAGAAPALTGRTPGFAG
ncbi:type VI secretion system secreted protein VgrG [Variovorax sp. TBS-050B]|uniref:type VI secretion system Vgr family protein n=1 Tax=Variovorax sp. TBS-050B TaxID=2940551 RepID=UPI002472F4CB|nr:type VI secretion system tip protein TssI/VgrG [Variovorax sp. TBS-050B]MDH6593887.1 type VI secretion system secreted protein VgrG [Variovorax sp. TBS-050B]